MSVSGKMKAPVPRTYDEDGYKLRAGCLIYKDVTKREILLVSSSRDENLWVVPAGGIDPGECAPVAAVREANEEAGVVGSLIDFVGIFQNDKKIKTRTYIYSMVSKNLVPMEEKRLRRWFSVKDVSSKLKHPIQLTYLTTDLLRDT